MALRDHWDETPAHFAKIYESRRDVLVDGLNNGGWNIIKPKATMFTWAPMPEDYKYVGSIRFSQFLLKEADVCVSPGMSFGKEGEGFVRIAMVENEERIQQAVRQIKRAMQNSSPDAVMKRYSGNFD